ncbi:50S ribosomal protein L30 [Clostridia bacterium]|nr:50S ribosomal protein L30 [Clostridia bacterium]
MAKIRIKLVKSLVGRKDSHIATAISLGLRKIGAVTEQPDNDATRGKLHHIKYLVKTEAV